MQIFLNLNMRKFRIKKEKIRAYIWILFRRGCYSAFKVRLFQSLRHQTCTKAVSKKWITCKTRPSNLEGCIRSRPDGVNELVSDIAVSHPKLTCIIAKRCLYPLWGNRICLGPQSAFPIHQPPSSSGSSSLRHGTFRQIPALWVGPSAPYRECDPLSSGKILLQQQETSRDRTLKGQGRCLALSSHQEAAKLPVIVPFRDEVPPARELSSR